MANRTYTLDAQKKEWELGALTPGYASKSLTIMARRRRAPCQSRERGILLSRNFKSDNVTPVCEPIMAAINAANSGSAPSYGGDQLTQRLQTIASEVFGTEVAIFPVTTGTA